MTIPHLKQRAEFYSLCLEHGDENVEWTWRYVGDSEWSKHWLSNAESEIGWYKAMEYKFRVRPLTTVIPEAMVPDEDPEGMYCMYIQTWIASPANFGTGPCKRYRTKEDLDAVVAAMLRRERK